MKQFRESSIRRVYDSIHGISAKDIPLSNAVEIMAYCLIDGKVDQESGFETNLYNELVEQLREMKAGFYSLKTCDAFGMLYVAPLLLQSFYITGSPLKWL